MAQQTISDFDYCNLLEQLDQMLNDKDRIRLITAAAESHWYRCEDVRGLCDQQHYGDSKRATAIQMYPRVVDPENFLEEVVEGFQFEEDKVEIKTALGLGGGAAAPVPAAAATPVKAGGAVGGGGGGFCNMCGAEKEGRFCSMCGSEY